MNNSSSAPKVVLTLAALVAVAAAVSVLVRRPAAGAPFAEMILSSRQFAEPMRVKVNREPLPAGSLLFDRQIVPEAYVLAALGLLDIQTRVSFAEVKPERRYAPPNNAWWALQRQRPTPTPVYVPETNIEIGLTEKGRLAAAGWEVTSKGEGAYRIDWWRVPVGHREFLKIESVDPAPRGPGEPESLFVHFKWRWRPNEIGAAFDRSGPGRHMLPDEARDSPLARRDSASTYDGIALFKRGAGGWELAEVFCDVLRDEYTGKNIPLADVDWP